MDVLITNILSQLMDPFLDPSKRIHLGYLASALIIAMLVLSLTARGRVGKSWRTLFTRDIWWSASARADYKILIFNQLLLVGAMPRLLSKLAVATLLFEGLHVWVGGRALLLTEAPDWSVAALFTFLLFLADDATKYLVHRALHEWPPLWAFHKVHHTAETLTPFTVYRTHPIEGLIFALRAVLVQGAVIGALVFFLGPRAELVTVLGANVLLFVFNVAGSNLRHSHLWLSYGRVLERVLISPAQHQIHHSAAPEHRDHNYGAVLAIWDGLAGSLILAENARQFEFGLGGSDKVRHDLISIYVTPFADLARWAQSLARPGWTEMKRSLPASLKRRARILGGLLAFCLGLLAVANAEAGQELNIYSHRQPFLIQPFIDAYTAETGTRVNIVYASKGLAQRLQAEGARSPADVVLTVDIARLHVYADKDLLAPVSSEVLARDIPAHLRDPENRWFAFSKRARVIVVSKQTPDAHAIARYEDLADPKWKGRICSRPGSHVYNRALVASMIHAHGAAKTQEWARGVVGNLARRPQGNDRAQVKAIFEGVCDIAIINNYYFGKLKHSDKPDQRKWAASVKLIFPNQGDRGTHVNISGGGVAKHSKNKAEAVRFLEFLTSQKAQELYGAINFEYPVNPAVTMSDELKSWGGFTEDTMPIARVAELAPDAQKVIDRARW